MAKHEIEWVNIEVDGVPLRVRKDRYLLWSLREAYYDVPHFCAHKWLDPPFAGCRMCMVQIETGGKMWPKLQTSCSTLPSEGMKVYLKTEPVVQARKEELEFHLLNHPLECPVCDKGGECMLQDQSMDHGVSAGRYIEEKRIRPDAILNDYMRMNYKRCFHCKRCVHYGENIDGANLMKFVKRGAETRIESYPEPGEAPRFSGNLIDICPVGAITARSYRFMGRPWEQELRHSVGSFDSVGANIWLCSRLGEMARVIPHDNDQVEFGLIDDVTRFAYECVNDPRLLSRATLRSQGGSEQVSQGRGESEAGRRLAAVLGEHGPDSIGVLAGSGLNSEEYLALAKWCGSVLGSGYYHFGESLFAGAAPSAAALSSFVHEHPGIDEIVNASTVLSLGCDLFEEAPALGLRVDIAARRKKLKLLSARSHRSDADRFATLFVNYGYHNLLRLVRGLSNALSGAGECPEEFKPLAEQLRSIGDDCAVVYGQEVWQNAAPAELIEALSALRSAIAAANGGKPVWLSPVFPGVNSAGALLLGNLSAFGVSAGSELKPAAGGLKTLLEAAASGKLRALVIFDYDILSTYPDRALVRKALDSVGLVVYCGPFENPTSEAAHIQLPLGSFAQREGTVVSMEWRVQKREAAVLEIAAADVAEVLNGLTTAMQGAAVADTMQGLYLELCERLPQYPREAFVDFPYEGRRMKPQLAEAAPAQRSELPAEFKGSADFPLVLVPKRFLYNDRAEIRCSPVFDQVAKPFHAFMNPQDMKVYNLAAGDQVELQDDKGSSTLPIQSASWVRPGSVVINDYCIAAPVNVLAGFDPVRVRPRKAQPAKAGEAALASSGGAE
ncbi:(2Fe-2S)-binding protein [bacterium]|nr:(2Fe-2S)-binding protein [bacterium]